ncbi:MAG: AAA family ATPase [Candidatus Aminicenantes bacterium]|nr:AAA family ATPase [Candidatus Aminicenantes bacterium]
MRLRWLRVQNLRSIADCGEFELKPLFGMVGENNSGKSNLLRAMDVLVSAGAGRLSREDFKNPSVPIIIKGTFDGLTASEKKRWKPYLVEGRLILEKHVYLTTDERTAKEKATAEFHGYKSEPTAIHLSVRKILEKYGDKPKWAEIVKQEGLPDYFLQDGKSTKAEFSKSLDRYLNDNDVPYDPPDLSTTQALGLQSNVVAALPNVYLLPAITDYSDEIDRRSSSSTFRRLMGDLSGRILQRDSRFIEIQAALDKIRGLLNRVDADDAPKRMESLSIVEAKIAELLRRIMPSVQSVALAVEVQNLSDLFSAGVNLEVNDGIQTDVLAKGHGLQRCIVFTLLQALILNERNQLVIGKEEVVSERPIILLIEEPELYIHPQLSKLFFDAMREFSRTDQVIYSTHSPLFVDAYEPEQVAIVSKVGVEEGTKVRTCDVNALSGLTERQVFQGFSRLNPATSEIFFARRVLLVEGLEDLIALTATLQKIGKIKQRVEEIDWSVIPCGGKPAIPFFQRLLNSFGMSYSVLHDLDLEEGMAEARQEISKKRNETIKQLAGSMPVHVFPVSLERSLGRAEHFADQYEAHRFFLDPNNITVEVQSIIEGVFP